MIKSSNHKKIIVNSGPNNVAARYLNQELVKLKEIDKFRVTVGDFNTPF